MRRIIPTLLAATLAALTPAPALASGDDVLRDCGDDEQLSKRYGQSEYRDALDNISADLRQYTNCQAVIRQAQLAAAGGRDGDAGGGGASGIPGLPGSVGAAGGPSAAETLAEATPEQRQELAEAVEETPDPITLPGAGPIDPASAGTVPGIDAVSDLPAPLGVLLVLMVAAAGAVGVNRLRSRGDRRSA
jgi:hypothetical protein